MSVSAMRRVVVPRRASVSRVLANYQGMAAPTTRKAAASTVDVFLSHRGVDTKSTVAGLLYDRLAQMGVRPFLDSRSMEPGDKIYERVDAGIRQSRVGVAIFSPRYCDSVFCLHELAMMVEAGKKLIPIFYDVKPAELAIGAAVFSAAESPEDLARYARAIREAKLTVGLTFDSKKGDWSDLVSRTSNVVLKCLKQAKRREQAEEKRRPRHCFAPPDVSTQAKGLKDFKEDLENQDSNQSMRLPRPTKTQNNMKEMIKSSVGKKVEEEREEPKPESRSHRRLERLFLLSLYFSRASALILTSSMGKGSGGFSSTKDKDPYLRLSITLLAALCRVLEIASSEEMVSKVPIAPPIEQRYPDVLKTRGILDVLRRLGCLAELLPQMNTAGLEVSLISRGIFDDLETLRHG
ncbi:hypothetical protein ZIOFF_029374 [Zingiber officinale]|uniref:TIR domain-containing protein n=1 Tax=Zingiber officinale TaxID=94328 RepID=A0A8J5L455_ZINOF|nr:hypothetical protein ZIOFF_029374 [Zingiber officinale]